MEAYASINLVSGLPVAGTLRQRRMRQSPCQYSLILRGDKETKNGYKKQTKEEIINKISINRQAGGTG